MASYQLKASHVTGDYAFDLQMFNQLIQEPPFNEVKFTLTKLFAVVNAWPQKINWPQFNHHINHFLQAWLNDYDAGAHLDFAFLLTRCLSLRPISVNESRDSMPDSSLNAKFQYLLMHLIARVTSQFDQYKFTHIQNFDLETGLPNQQLMLNILDKHLQVEHKNPDLSSTHIGLILVNLNIDLGEESQLSTTSSLIMAAVHTIKQQLNENSTVCRVGPIELAIITKHVRFPAQLNLITSKIIHAFESALPLNNITLILKPYFGGVSSLKTQQNGMSMYDCAKLALHHAMANNYDTEFYDQDITDSLSNSHQLDEGIIHALQQNELEIYLQPIISLQNKKPTNPMMQEANSKVTCVSAEVLLRWHNENLQSISPQRLIDTIYKKGFGKVFIRWLINNACQRVAELKSIHQRNIALTINLSGTDLLDADLPELLAQSIALWQIPAENLIIEITENDLLIDEAKATLVIDKIVALGCKLALDDFGTGYSSMTRLRSMPIHLVKIDQSFVRNIANSSQDKAIVLSVVKLAHSLGKAVVAEGVEDIACLNILKDMKCEKIQGYYYAKPMRFDAFIPWLSAFEDEQLNLKPNSLTATDNTLI
ncbi:MAG TPA: GGDEF domain-containing phosphodiesterase [Methylotenera sp.]|nr:GGDEF domain-containing phosphodiesterase [Methylotenera sp.]